LIDFENGLNSINQGNLLSYYLGKLFACSPIGEDGYYPHEKIREVIENKHYFSEELKSSYCTKKYNDRGVFSPSAGKNELEISKAYKNNADHLRLKYPNTATIYDDLALTYIHESYRERIDAEEKE